MKDNEKGIIKRLNIYQKERFPILVLLFTTTSVILSSTAVSIPLKDNPLNYLNGMIVAFVTLILFMFHIRVLDEYRDYKFDSKYHTERPVQRGVISLKELLILDVIGLILQATINIIYLDLGFISWLVAFGYTFLAGNDFFLKKWLRKKFYLYNLLNLLQMLFLQIYLYIIIVHSLKFENILLIIHFIFVLLNIGLLEFGRKLKTRSEEGAGNDTYSSRMGIKKASFIYIFICLLIYALFLYMLISLLNSLSIYAVLALVPLNISIISIIFYLRRRDKMSTRMVEISTVLFYISTHILLFLGAIRSI